MLSKYHSHTQDPLDASGKFVFSILPKDTQACGLEEPGIKPIPGLLALKSFSGVSSEHTHLFLVFLKLTVSATMISLITKNNGQRSET